MAEVKFVCITLLCLVIRLSTSNETVASPCCQLGRILDVEQQKCIVQAEEFVTETYAEETEATDPFVRCPNGWTSFTTLHRPIGAVIEPQFNQTLAIGDYCVHSIDNESNEATIVHCRPTAAMVNKCCPDGYAVNRTSIGECAPTGNVFNASVYVKPIGYPFALRSGVSLTCEHDYNVYLPSMFVDHKFQVLAPTGELYVQRAMYKVFRSVSDYCIDSAIQASGDEEVS